MPKFHKSLAVRLAAFIALVVIAAFLSAYLIISDATRSRFITVQREVVSSVAEAENGPGVVPEIQRAFLQGGIGDVVTLAAAQRSSGDARSKAFIFLTPDQKVAAASDPIFATAEIVRNPDGMVTIAAGDAGGMHSARIEVSQSALLAILDASGRTAGEVVLLPAPFDETEGGEFANSIWRISAIWLVGIAAASIAATLFLTRRALAPIDALTNAAKDIKQGLAPAPLRAPGTSEFGQLVEAFNAAAESIEMTGTMRRQLVADIAHELRTPVTNLIGQIEAFQSGLIPNQSEFVATIDGEAKLLRRLVEDFQQLAISDAGQLRLTMQELPVADLLETILRPAADASGALLDIDAGDNLCVLADEERMRQVFGNLFENSLRHRPNGLKVAVRAHACGEGVAIAFADNGPGVCVEDRPFIFDRFYRAEKSRNRATGGAGLGLAIVNNIMDAMGGKIRYDDKPTPLGGAVFVLWFRRAA
jgi:signal transduction histidine kinase